MIDVKKERWIVKNERSYLGLASACEQAVSQDIDEFK